MLVRPILLHWIAAAALFSAVLAEAPAAQSLEPKKPPVPPGRDPGGVAVALIGTGIDYTLPAGGAAAELLAREPALDAAALKRRLGEAGGAALWQAQR